MKRPPSSRHKAPYWTNARRAAARRRVPRLRTVPLATVDRCEVDLSRRVPSAERVYCTCGKVFAGGSVVNDPPFIDHGGECTVMRRCYCDHCDHLMMWFELALPNGTPLGLVQGELAVTRARSVVETFLKKHPWAAGVLQT